MNRTLKPAALAVVFAALGALSFDAAAATIRVQCEVRATRAKISVDAKGLAAGSYRTQAVSGGNMAQSVAERAVGGEVETDYDSNPADIAAGATAISSSFVVNGQVAGKVIDSLGNTVIADTVACRVRSR